MDDFILIICNRFELNHTLAKQLWTEYHNYSKLKKSDLVSLCNEGNYENRGLKKELIQSLLDKTPRESSTPKGSPTKVVKKLDVVEKIIENKPIIEIQKNKHGMYEHLETNMIFDKITKHVIGRNVTDNGEVSVLQEQDFETCKRFGFDVCIPANLNTAVYQDEHTEKDELNIDSLLEIDDESEDEEIIMEL